METKLTFMGCLFILTIYRLLKILANYIIMSLTNFSVDNTINAKENSLTLNSVAANPGGNRTIWIDNSFGISGYLRRGNVNLEEFTRQAFIPATVWKAGATGTAFTYIQDANGFMYARLSAQPNIISFNPFSGASPSGFALTSFTLVYRVTNTLSTAVVLLSSFPFINNTNPTTFKSNVPITGSMTLTSSANFYVSTFTVNGGGVGISSNSTLNVTINIDSAGGAKVVDFVGCFVNYVNTN